MNKPANTAGTTRPAIACEVATTVRRPAESLRERRA